MIAMGRLDVNVLNIWLSGIFAVVKSVDKGTMIEPVLATRCSLYPNIQPFVLLNPHIASVSIPECGTISFFIDDLCHIEPLALIRVLSVETIYGSTIFSRTKSSPIDSSNSIFYIIRYCG